MVRVIAGALLLVGLAVGPACETSSSDERTTGAGPHDAGPRDAGRDAGQPPPGAGGGCECSETADCAATVEALLEELRAPAAPSEDGRRAGSTCAIREPGADPDCLCHHVWGDMTAAVPENDWVLGNRETCDIFGRAPGTCAVPASEFTGCDPAVADSCEALCDRAHELVLADLAATHEGELRHAECTPFELGCSCRNVFRIDDRCYAATGPNARSYDCALSDAEILALAHPDPGPTTCTDDVCDGGAGI